MMRITSWTVDRIELLRKLVPSGISYAEIAAEIGGITRNAAIGMARRIGISEQRPQPASKPKPKRLHIRLSTAPERKPPTPRHTGISTPGWMPEELPGVIPVSQRRTLLELTDETCRFPIGEPTSRDFFFCGGCTITGSPYCAYHSRVAYKPSTYGRPDVASPPIAGEAA